MHHYCISGLNVASEIVLPGAIQRSAQASRAEIQIRLAAVPRALAAAAMSGPDWQMAGESFLLRVPKVARFHVFGGREISVDLEGGATQHEASAFVLGSAFGILLHQRGALVLHASAVARNGGAIVICGPSGAGKSTFAAALCREGCAFVADDIAVIGLDAERRPVVLPDGRRLKLWSEAIERLALEDRKCGAVRETFEKYHVTPDGDVIAAPRLAAVYVLCDTLPTSKDGIERLALPDAVRVLDHQAYRPGLREKIGRRPDMLAQSAAVLSHTNVFLLTRTRGFEHLADTTARVLAHWDSLRR